MFILDIKDLKTVDNYFSDDVSSRYITGQKLKFYYS